jgi:hypothetical protein
MRIDFHNPAEYRPFLRLERIALAIAVAVLILIGISDVVGGAL